MQNNIINKLLLNPVRVLFLNQRSPVSGLGFYQAQPLLNSTQLQLQLRLRLAIFPDYLATHPPTRNSSF